MVGKVNRKSPMLVLWLHRMGDPLSYRSSVYELEFMLKDYCSDIFTIVHDADLPVPDFIQRAKFDLIVLGPTFLCSRYDPMDLQNVIERYNFVKEADALKVALPQDDYDCCHILDNWLNDWDVSLVYSICPDKWDLLYPKCSKNSQIRLGYTGYISEKLTSYWSNRNSYNQRPIDISYRASRLPANFGYLGQLKWKIAEKFLASVDAKGALNCDISVKPEDTIHGTAWHSFLGSSKACIVTPSGSSLMDPKGDIRRCVIQSARLNLEEFSDIENMCFPDEDGKFHFTMLSPRNIEAAFLGTVQVAIVSEYSGILKPYEHYIPLDYDFINIKEIEKILHDEVIWTKIQENCKEAIYFEKRLHFSTIINELIEFYEENTNKTSSDLQIISDIYNNYYNSIEGVSKSFWQKRRMIIASRRFVGSILGSKIKTKIKKYMDGARSH